MGKIKETMEATKNRAASAKSSIAEARKNQPKVVKEFAQFINKGNVIDLAVGVIIGGAFGKIVTALVDYIIMPIVGMIIGGIDFSNIYVTVPNWLGDGAGVNIYFGLFIQSVVDFLIVAFCVFVFVKFVTQFKIDFKEEIEEEAKADPSNEEKIITLLESIDKKIK